MNWDQIERQWAAMTRRVQCDWRPKTRTGLPEAADAAAAAAAPPPAAAPLPGTEPATARPVARPPLTGATAAD